MPDPQMTTVYLQTIGGKIYHSYGGEPRCIPYTKSLTEAKRQFETFEKFELIRLDGEP